MYVFSHIIHFLRLYLSVLLVKTRILIQTTQRLLRSLWCFIPIGSRPTVVRLPSDRRMLMWRCVCLQPTMHWVSVTVMDVDPGAELKSSSLTPGVLSCWEGYCVEQSGAYTHALARTHTQKHSHLLRKASEMWGPAIHTLCGVPTAVNTTTSHTRTHTSRLTDQ